MSNKHISNINKTLKNIRSEILADFVCTDHQGLIIIINKIIFQSNLNTIENYIKNVNVIKLENIISLYLPQSKSYLKIISILYIIEDTNISIYFNAIKSIIQSMYIFNDVCLVSELKVMDFIFTLFSF